MALALTLALQMLAAAEEPCYFVGNTLILQLPSSDISPSAIDALTEEPSPARAGGRPGPVARAFRGGARLPRPAVVVRGNEELERRLEAEQRQRMEAVAARLGAEKQRDAALEERDRARRDLVRVRSQLARAVARLERIGSAASTPADDPAAAPHAAGGARPAGGSEPSP